MKYMFTYNHTKALIECGNIDIGEENAHTHTILHIQAKNQLAFHSIGKYHENTDVMTTQHMVTDNIRCQGW